ncbi:MAG: aromatic-L-amino-acid decarboxylase [Chlamydiales bacterium]|jgi:aromatic-L-amino-acid decarboxylase
MDTLKNTDSILRRLAEVEGASLALEESAEDRRVLTERVVGFADQVLDGLAKRPVWSDEPGARDELLAQGIPEEPADLDQVMDLVAREIDGPGLQPASGGHMGYIAGGGIYASALGDYMAAVTNRYAGVHYAGPGAVHVENLLLRWLCSMVGYPSGALGTLTSGGSIANLIALVTARDARGVRAVEVERSVIYLTDQTHHCVLKAITIAGLSEAPIRFVPMDERYRMDARALGEQIAADRAQGLRPFLLVASAGTTDAGALDPLEELADIAERENLWYHVDAAYGGVFMLVESMRERLRGIERADSIVVDPHKGLFVAYGSGALLVRDPELLRASHGLRAAYLQDAPDTFDEPSPADLSPELTRHFRGLRLWLPLQVHGVARFRAALEEKQLLCHLFYKRVQELGFEVGPEPDLSVALFRWVPKDGSSADDFNRRLLSSILDDGRVFLSSTTIDGVFWIRVAVLCFRSHRDRIEAVLEIIARETKTD